MSTFFVTKPAGCRLSKDGGTTWSDRLAGTIQIDDTDSNGSQQLVGDFIPQAKGPINESLIFRATAGGDALKTIALACVGVQSTQDITQQIYYSQPASTGVNMHVMRDGISPIRQNYFSTSSTGSSIQTWNFASNGNQKIAALGSDLNSTGTVFLKFSADGGKNWTDKSSVVVAAGLGINSASVVEWLNGSNWICFGRYGSYYTTDDFTTVTSLGAPLTNAYNHYALSDDHSTVYIAGYGTNNAVVKKFAVGDSAWTTVYTLASSATKYIAVIGSIITLYVSSSQSYISLNGGTSFTGLGYYINSIIKLASGRIVFFTSGTATLRYSDDSGATINNVDNTQFPSGVMAAVYNNIDNKIYVIATIGGTLKLCVSDSTGISYTVLGNAPSSMSSVNNISFSADNKIIVSGYSLSSSTLAESGNSGESWYYPEVGNYTSNCFKAACSLVESVYAKELKSVGDSIMVGHNASNYENLSYRSLIAANGHLAKSSTYAYTGWRIYNAQKAVYGNISRKKQDLYIENLGTNDRADNHNDATFTASKKALMAYVAFPDSTNKFSARSIAAGSRTGTWVNETDFGIGLVSATNGSSLTFQVSGDVAMIAYRANTTNAGGVASVTIDGVSKGNIAGADGNKDISMLKVYTGLGIGSHTVVITVTSATSSSNSLGVHWVAGSDIPANVECPNYCAVAITPRTDGWGAATAWNAITASIVSDLKSYNNRIKIWMPDIITGFNTSTMIDADQIHLTDTGHSFVASAVVSSVSANYSLSV